MIFCHYETDSFPTVASYLYITCCFVLFTKDDIYKIKKSFNAAFDEIYRSKTAEVKRIEEKNVRIKKILTDLNLNDDILQPVMDPEECPETLLDVKDSEVPFDRFITKEEQIKIEEEKQREEGNVCIAGKILCAGLGRRLYVCGYHEWDVYDHMSLFKFFFSHF